MIRTRAHFFQELIASTHQIRMDCVRKLSRSAVGLPRSPIQRLGAFYRALGTLVGRYCEDFVGDGDARVVPMDRSSPLATLRSTVRDCEDHLSARGGIEAQIALAFAVETIWMTSHADSGTALRAHRALARIIEEAGAVGADADLIEAHAHMFLTMLHAALDGP